MGAYPSTFPEEGAGPVQAWPLPMPCEVCSRVPDVQTICSQCHLAHYCSIEHQKLAWEQGHKDECTSQLAATTAFINSYRKVFGVKPGDADPADIAEFVAKCRDNITALYDAANTVATRLESLGDAEEARAVKTYVARVQERANRLEAAHMRRAKEHIAPVPGPSAFAYADTIKERQEMIESLMPYVHQGIEAVAARLDALDLEDAFMPPEQPLPRGDAALERLVTRIMEDKLDEIIRLHQSFHEATSEPLGTKTPDLLKAGMFYGGGIMSGLTGCCRRSISRDEIAPDMMTNIDEMTASAFIQYYVPQMHADVGGWRLRRFLYTVGTCIIDPGANIAYWTFKKLFPRLILSLGAKPLSEIQPRLKLVRNTDTMQVKFEKTKHNMDILIDAYPWLHTSLVAVCWSIGTIATYTASYWVYKTIDQPSMVSKIQRFEDFHQHFIGNQTAFNNCAKAVREIEDFENTTRQALEEAHNQTLNTFLPSLSCNLTANGAIECDNSMSAGDWLETQAATCFGGKSFIPANVAAYIDKRGRDVKWDLVADCINLGVHVNTLNASLGMDDRTFTDLETGAYAFATQLVAGAGVNIFAYANTSFARPTRGHDVMIDNVEAIIRRLYGTNVDEWGIARQMLYMLAHVLTPYGSFMAAYQTIVDSTVLRTRMPGGYGVTELQSMNRTQYQNYLTNCLGNIEPFNDMMADVRTRMHRDIINNFTVDYWSGFWTYTKFELVRGSFMTIPVLLFGVKLARSRNGFDRIARVPDEQTLLPYFWFRLVYAPTATPTMAREGSMDALAVYRWHQGMFSGNPLYDWYRWVTIRILNPIRMLFVSAAFLRGIQHLWNHYTVPLSVISQQTSSTISILENVAFFQATAQTFAPVANAAVSSATKGWLNSVFSTSGPSTTQLLLLYNKISGQFGSGSEVIRGAALVDFVAPVVVPILGIFSRAMNGASQIFQRTTQAVTTARRQLPSVDVDEDDPSPAVLAQLRADPTRAAEIDSQRNYAYSWAANASLIFAVVGMCLYASFLWNVYEGLGTMGKTIYATPLQQKMRNRARFAAASH